jgi:aminopeptidase N
MPISHRLHARCGHIHLNEEQQGSSARPFAFAHSPRQFERDRPFLVDHLALDVALDVRSVDATATLDVRRVDPEADAITFDAIGFEIGGVTVSGTAARYAYDGRAITVPIALGVEKARVAITYRATPRRGLYFLEPDEHYPDRPRQVWSQCQEEDARHFIPCHDKPHVKMTTEVTVTAPHGWSVLSNGALVSKKTPAAGAWQFHWKMSEPHSSYLLTLVAGEFVTLDAKAGDVPLTYLVPKGREADGARTFARTPDMIAHFAKLTGVPYPWNKYAQIVVSDFIFGGMENTTATTMYEHILLDARAQIDVSSDDLISHELAHQWFGDYVTCRDWSEAWLNEGFATYMEHVWKEKLLGKDEYEYAVKGDLASYLSEASGRYRRPIVCSDYDSPLDLFDRHLYEKGGLVLHMLRTELGDEMFWEGVGLYLTRNALSIVETRDLQRALEEVSGRSLGRFFEQWVYRPGHPEVEATLSWEKGVLKVVLKQQQATTDGVPAVFEFPLHLDVADAAGTRREKVLVAQKTETFAIPCPTRPSFVVVDPDARILGEVHVKAPNDMLRAQLAGAVARGAGAGDQRRAADDRRARRAAPRRRGALGCARRGGGEPGAHPGQGVLRCARGRGLCGAPQGAARGRRCAGALQDPRGGGGHPAARAEGRELRGGGRGGAGAREDQAGERLRHAARRARSALLGGRRARGGHRWPRRAARRPRRAARARAHAVRAAEPRPARGDHGVAQADGRS